MKKEVYKVSIQLVNQNCEKGLVSMPIHFEFECFVDYNSENWIDYIFIRINEVSSLERSYKYLKKTNYALKEISDILFNYWTGTNGSYIISYLNIKKISN